MAANNIELITTYSPKYWDLVYKQEAVTSVLDANPKMVQFTGTKTVKIGKWQNGGLQNYYRNNEGDDRVTAAGNQDFAGAAGFGYQKSSARLVWEEFTLQMDRGAAFEIEYFDNEESGDEIVGNCVSEISRTAIVPEVDAYCLSKIASYAAGKATDSEADKPIAALNKAFVYMANHEVPIEDQIIFASPDFVNSLRTTAEAGIMRTLGQGDLGANKDVTFEVTSYMGRNIITVSPDRLRTDFQAVASGATGGYFWGANSKKINFLMVAKSAVMHVVKYNKVKIISGEANLAGRGFDGYTVFARIYHDVFVPENKRIAIYCDLAAAPSAGPAMTLDVESKNGKISGFVQVPGDKLTTYVKSSASETVGQTATGTLTRVNIGDAIAAEDVIYAVDSDKKVLAKYTQA